MATDTQTVRRKMNRGVTCPSYVWHETFDGRKALNEYVALWALETEVDFEGNFMPDDVTKDHTKRMHYAAHRMHKARTNEDMTRWQSVYLSLRDRIVMGNRKLIFRAVRRRMAMSNRADDLIGDCQIVLIQAVAVFNPWLGIRFSTYAYTCLMRALSRINQRQSSDWLSRAIPLDVLPEGGPAEDRADAIPTSTLSIDMYLRDGHPLLTHREKQIIARRFTANDEGNTPTLETVGRAIGLSKERVRQVQATALEKLRLELAAI